MNIQYGVTRLHFGNSDFLELTQEEYQSIQETRNKLHLSLQIEDNFNIVLENYEEFEHEVLGKTLHNLLFSQFDWSSFMNDRSTINRRIINLLTTCRLYLDQTPHSLNALYGDNSTQKESFISATNQEYDTKLGYRVLEALRNYVQHRGLPIQGLGHNLKRPDGIDGPAKRMMRLNLDVTKLKGDGKFKQSVISELEQLGEKVDLKPFMVLQELPWTLLDIGETARQGLNRR
jgi:hypothetical protein